MSTRAAPLAVIGVCAVAACGGASASDNIAKTIKIYARAVADGDAVTACDQLTPGYTAFSGGGGCRTVMDVTSKLLSAQQKTLLRQVKVESVHVTGNTATATVRYGREVRHLKLELSAGRWRVVPTGGP